MTCKEMELYFEEWRSGRAPAAFEEHLRQCVACRELAEELGRAAAWLGATALEAPEPGPAFWARLRARLEEADRRADFWGALGWVAGRAALVLSAVVLILTVWVWRESAPSNGQVAFDAPQSYLEDSSLPGTGAGRQLNRDEVLLTLVAQQEPPR
ncbi:MAG: hypothetical protein ACRD35_02930 [Candidatus Acidiferrales bacterium]